MFYIEFQIVPLSFHTKYLTCTLKDTGLILGLHFANEKQRYFVTTSLIGWAQILNQTSDMFIQWRPFIARFIIANIL